MVMATPIDSALLATQTYKPRKPVADARPRTSVFTEDEQAAGPAIVSRRTRSGVAVTLSTEALQLLSGNGGSPERNRPSIAEEAPARTGATAGTATGFELPADTPPPQREAPFAHVARDDGYRLAQPGSRLDISV